MANILTMPQRYAPSIRAQYPTARQRYFQNLAYEQGQNALTQNAQQFDESMELQRQQMEEQQKQSYISNLIAAGGLAKTAYPYLKAGAMDLYGYLNPPTGGPEAVSQAVSPAYTTEGYGSMSAYPEFQPGYGESLWPSDYSPDILPDLLPAASSGYAASAAPIYEAMESAYTTAGLSSLAAEAAPVVGAGEAAIPIAGAAPQAAEIGQTAGTAAEGTSLASSIGTAALLYAPYGLFKAFQKNKPSLRSWWPYLSKEQKDALMKSDPEYAQRAGLDFNADFVARGSYAKENNQVPIMQIRGTGYEDAPWNTDPELWSQYVSQNFNNEGDVFNLGTKDLPQYFGNRGPSFEDWKSGYTSQQDLGGLGDNYGMDDLDFMNTTSLWEDAFSF